MTLILSMEDVKSVLKMKDCIEVVEEAFRQLSLGNVVQPTRPTDREFCGTCHADATWEATGVPQVSLSSHGERYLCWQCHYPHFPEIGQ